MRKNLIVESVTPGQIPFLDQLIEKELVFPGDCFEIHEVSESRKRTGFILKADRFMIFLWKSSEVLQPLLSELEEMARQPHAPSLWIEVSEKNVEGFIVYFDDEPLRQWVRSKKKFVLEQFQAKSIIKLEEKRKRSSVETK